MHSCLHHQLWGRGKRLGDLAAASTERCVSTHTHNPNVTNTPHQYTTMYTQCVHTHCRYIIAACSTSHTVAVRLLLQWWYPIYPWYPQVQYQTPSPTSFTFIPEPTPLLPQLLNTDCHFVTLVGTKWPIQLKNDCTLVESVVGCPYQKLSNRCIMF